ADYARSIFSLCALIFSRDQQSLSFAQPLVDQSDKLHLAPDFTILVKGVIPDDFPRELHNAVGILPNIRMLKKGDDISRSHYVSILCRSMDYLRQNDIPFFALCHQPDDQLVINMANEASGIDCTVIHDDDAVKIKGILGTCRFLFGSRYHGLINGLTQGVPCIATTWSHKYHSLFHEYDCSEYLIADLSDFSIIKRCFDQLSDQVVYQEVQQKIEKHNMVVREATKKMWKKVDQLLLSQQTAKPAEFIDSCK
ncbi:MAG: polysaccharide pyruvyl transferase family protein, partial [Planctomycetaceae bacterium]|nr:polysaccharide pyruvyl transferase family protein [Planctomycetaceae bacterium]